MEHVFYSWVCGAESRAVSSITRGASVVINTPNSLLALSIELSCL